MVEKNWKCKECGDSIESELEPRSCPCGSEQIEAEKQLSMLENVVNNFIGRDNKGKAET